MNLFWRVSPLRRGPCRAPSGTFCQMCYCLGPEPTCKTNPKLFHTALYVAKVKIHDTKFDKRKPGILSKLWPKHNKAHTILSYGPGGPGGPLVALRAGLGPVPKQFVFMMRLNHLILRARTFGQQSSQCTCQACQLAMHVPGKRHVGQDLWHNIQWEALYASPNDDGSSNFACL